MFVTCSSHETLSVPLTSRVLAKQLLKSWLAEPASPVIAVEVEGLEVELQPPQD
jgi:hypothetical protein